MNFFWEKAQFVPTVSKQTSKSLFLWPYNSYLKTWIKLETIYKPPQGTHVFSKVPFVTFELANFEDIGDNQMLPDSVFSVSSYILVFR